MLILAEKPSVAKSFADALGAKRNPLGFYETENIAITNCVGHLYELAKPEEYDAAYKFFSFSNLPIIPEKWLYSKNPKAAAQANLVTRLLKKHSGDTVLIATDADREGEVIARIAVRQAGIRDTSNFTRFWVSEALTKETVVNGIKSARRWSEYDDLAKRGFARQKADWLVGMNLSPFVTLSSGNGETFPVGRVQTAVLAAVAQRNNEVAGFKPAPYGECAALVEDGDGNALEMLLVNPETKKTSFPKDDEYIQDAISFSQKDKAITVEAEVERKSLRPPHLLGITELQQKAASLHDFSSSRTLEAAQKLYEERKCLSYPRTPSTVMGDDDVGLFKEKFELLKGTSEISKYSDVSLIDGGNKFIFNSKKLDSHHALIPLDFLPNGASDDERKIYEIVLKSFFMACMPPCIYDEKKLTMRNGGYAYKATVNSVVEAGWKAVENEGDGDGIKRFCEKRCALKDVKAVEKMTQPKKEFTESALLAFMKNPKAQESDEKLVGLGTSATRASIIQKLQEHAYLVKDKKKFYATRKGRFLLRQLFKNDMTKRIAGIGQTTEWERKLEEAPDEFEAEIKDYIKKCVAVKADFEKYEPPSVGKCPLCGKDVVERRAFFGCAGYCGTPKCGFAIWKAICGARISPADAATLLSGKTTAPKKMKGKAGKEFSAGLKMNAETGKIDFVFEKPNRTAGKKRKFN